TYSSHNVLYFPLHLYLNPPPPLIVIELLVLLNVSNTFILVFSIELLVLVVVQWFLQPSPHDTTVFIHKNLIEENQLEAISITPRPAYAINGEEIQDGGIRQAITGELVIENHRNKQKFHVADIG
ncbi:hypothetical protein FRB97_008585, partial [Tulasnella sp. 331]